MQSHPTCQECGTSLTASPYGKKFCSDKCRSDFNNRRLQRGATLYDFFMTLRYERDKAKDEKVWGAMCRLAEAMRDEDVEYRGGRNSWADVTAIMESDLSLKSTRLGRVRVGHM